LTSTNTNPLRILIADDQLLTREGLKVIVEAGGDLEVVGTAKNGAEAYEWVKKLEPDLVLMDVRMPVMDGISSLKLIKKEYPHIVILILTTFVEDEYIVEGLANGASGYLLKDMGGARLVASIHDAVAGQFVLQGIVAEKLAARLRASGLESVPVHLYVPPTMPQLTEREEEVARLLIQGHSNRDIGRRLHISDGTVRNYVSLIYSKLGVSSRGKAIVRLTQLLGS